MSDFLSGLRGVIFFIPALVLGLFPLMMVVVPLNLFFEDLFGDDSIIQISIVIAAAVWWVLILLSEKLEIFCCFFFSAGMWLLTGEWDDHRIYPDRKNKADKLFAGFLILLYVSFVSAIAYMIFVTGYGFFENQSAAFIKIIAQILAAALGVVWFGFVFLGGYKIWQKFVTNPDSGRVS